MTEDEAKRRIELQFGIVFQDYYDGLATWEECEQEFAIRARYYEQLVTDD